MSRTVRKQLFELLNTLQMANDMVGNLISGADRESLFTLLEDCQNCAITMGNKIETVYGSGTTCVSMLEAYCESVYQVSMTLEDSEKCQSAYRNSIEQLVNVQTAMEQSLPDKLEIAFMPYKVSMWDALESVYLRAKQDNNCEVYVVPIPYFDRKADKSLGTMHYEGAEYPQNITITDWQQYNYEERQPDVIYIHNAYDDMNLVTCVHPRFFSNNLKKYTSKLIYIPYFVLEEIEPDDYDAIEKMKHFCVLPGIIHADEVILQSEKMSQIYINEYAKAFEAAGVPVDKAQLKKKFLGLGSPKFDKVLKVKKENLEIPSEWLQVIQKEDGTYKKIIFYNTSVTALVQDEEKMLEKMCAVFAIFKERQRDVALLWRPHPLIKATIEAMRPKLWEEYAKLVEQYQEEGWGIYDDTPDLDRAVVLCDAYYGDLSSVTELVHKCNKPVLIQAVECEYQRKPFFYDCIWKDNEIYYPLVPLNAFCKTDLVTGETEIVDRFPESGKQQRCLYAGVYENERFLMFGPVRTNRSALLFYEFENQEYYEIKVEEEKKLWLNFRREQVFETEDYLYIFSLLTVVVKIKLSDFTIEYIPYPQIDIASEYHGQLTRVDNTIYLPLCKTDKIYSFDLMSEVFVLHELDPIIGGINTLCYDGKKFWLTGKEKGIFSWNEQTGECEKYTNFPSGFEKFVEVSEKEEFWFSNSVLYGSKIYFFPLYANMIIKYDFVKNTMKEIVVPNEDEQLSELNRKGRVTWGKYIVVKYKQGRILFLSSKNKVIYILDLEDDSINTIEPFYQQGSGQAHIDWKQKVKEIECSTGVVDLLAYLGTN